MMRLTRFKEVYMIPLFYSIDVYMWISVRFSPTVFYVCRSQAEPFFLSLGIAQMSPSPFFSLMIMPELNTR